MKSKPQREAHSLCTVQLAALMVMGAVSGCNVTTGGLLAPSPAAASGGTAQPAPAAGSTAPVAVPAGVAGTSNAQWPAERGCRILADQAVATDVDTLYGRLMRRWGLTTREQMQQRVANSNGMLVVDPSFKHDRQAGSYYRLAQSFKLENGLPFLGDVTLAKDGAGAVVSLKYCVYPRSPLATADGHAAIQSALLQSIR